jgi:hypothetical protein
LFDLRKENSRDKTLKGDEVAKERPSHFFPVIVGKIEEDPLTDKIDLTKEGTKCFHPLLKKVFLRGKETHKKFSRRRFFDLTHPSLTFPLKFRNSNTEIDFKGYPNIRLSVSGYQNVRVSGLIIFNSLTFPDILMRGILHADFPVP